MITIAWRYTTFHVLIYAHLQLTSYGICLVISELWVRYMTELISGFGFYQVSGKAYNLISLTFYSHCSPDSFIYIRYFAVTTSFTEMDLPH